MKKVKKGQLQQFGLLSKRRADTHFMQIDFQVLINVRNSS